MKVSKILIFKLFLSAVFFSLLIILFELFTTYYKSFKNNYIFNCPDDFCLEKKSKLFIKKNLSKNFVKIDRKTYYKKILNNSDQEAVVTIPPLRYKIKENMIYPLGGISNSDTIFCNESGYYVRYISDKFGFNNINSDYSNNIDYLLIGDSHTHGACVNNEDNFKGNINKLSKNTFGIINLGYQGTGPLHQYAIIREYLKVVRPKTVILFYYEGNDLSEIYEEMHQVQLKKYFQTNNYSQNLVSKHNEVDKILKNELKLTLLEHRENLFENKNNSYNFEKFKNVLKLTNIRSFFRLRKMNDENLKNFSLIIDKINNFLKKNNTDLIIVYLPDYQRYKGRFNDRYKNYNKIISLIKKKNIKLINIKNFFDNYKDPLDLFPYRLSGHYNEKGYKLISKEIFNNLKTN